MSEVVAISQPIVIPHVERQRWTDTYEQQLRQNISKSIRFILEYHRQPDRLHPHLHSFWEQLTQTRFRPSLHSLALDMIVALHPWPTRWGYWDEWEPQIRFAMRVAAAQNDFTRQAQLGGYLASILFHTGRTAETRQVIGQAITLARAGHSPVILAELSNVLIPLLIGQGQIEEAERWLESFQEDTTALIARHHPSPREQELTAIWLDMQRFSLLRRAGRADEAWAATDRMIRRLEALSDPPLFLLAESYNARGISAYLRADYTAAITDMNQAQALFAQEGDSYSVASVTGNLGHLYWSMGDLDRAQEAALECARVTEKLGAQWRLMMSLLQLMAVCLVKKQFEQALKHCQRRLDMEVRLNYPAYIPGDRLNRAAIWLYLDQDELAAQELQVLWGDEAVQTSPELRGRCAVLRAFYATRVGQPDTARQMAQHALEAAGQLTMPALRLCALRCLALVEPPEQAVSLLRQALEQARESNRRIEQAACLLSLAGLAGDEAEQSALWEQGSRLLVKMGAAAWLEECSPHNPPFLPLLV